MRFFPLIALLAAITSHAANYYVSPSGSDAADGSIGSPWLTIAHGITQLAGQDTLYLRGGTYTNDWSLNGIPSGASWAAPTTILAYPNEWPIIRPQTTNDVFGFNLTSGSYLCLRELEIDLTVSWSTAAGVKITENANHVLVTNCVIHHIASGHGILMTGGTADNADDNRIWNCVIHHAGYHWDGGTADHGIYVKNRRHSIAGCTIYSNNSHAIHAFDGNPEQMTIANCRTYSNETGIGLHSAGAVSNVVYNCIAYANNGIGFHTSYNANKNTFLNCTAWDNAVGFGVKEDCGADVVFENCLAFRNTSNDRSSSFRNLSSYAYTVRNCLSASNTINTVYSSTEGSTYSGNLTGDAYGVGLTDWSAGTNVFTLAPGSAAIDVGLPQTLFSTDFYGIGRPRGAGWDIGAFEFPFASPAPSRRNAAARPSL